VLITFLFVLLVALPDRALAQSSEESLVTQLRSFDSRILLPSERQAATQMIRRDAASRRDEVNRLNRDAWTHINSPDDWERFARPRIEALRQSLGDFPLPPPDLHEHVSATIEGDGYRIENLLYESRPGVFVTANVYSPWPLRERMPAILIIHSHHNPRTQGELQDMGMIWARQGCVVLVMDQLGYGERRQHLPGSRQDYRFRYIEGIQLHLIGDSLTGWMVWDVRRGLDLLLNRSGVAKDKVILIGSVAAGGDPAAVTAALDPRIACVVPFNFGGPQPETRFPLPDDAEQSFNYLGGGSWESTRNLRLSGRDGFLPWVIVASIAPRRLIYAHEFSWDREHDPVWRRLQQVFGFYDATNRLAFAHGRGLLSGQPPEASHCNNVGEVHRQLIHPALERWFAIPTPEERQSRLPPEKLIAFTSELRERLQPRPMHELFAEIGATRATAFRTQLAGLQPSERRTRLRQAWADLLGEVSVGSKPTVQSRVEEPLGSIRIERIKLEVGTNVIVPLLLLKPASVRDGKWPVIIGVAQSGKAIFLRDRARELAELLTNGVAICLPDVHGTGETGGEGSRGFQSEATSTSSTLLMLGQTQLGARLRDLRSVIEYLGTRNDLNSRRLALWGESFAPANPPGFADSLLGEGTPPLQSEPLGGLLALLGGLYEDQVVAVVARGTLAGFQSVLRDRYCYLPHDVVVPGALTAGDVCDVAAAFAPHQLRLEALVDGRNVLMPFDEVQRAFQPTADAYRAASNQFLLTTELKNDTPAWLRSALSKD
jgi:dienelactone hydrolase